MRGEISGGRFVLRLNRGVRVRVRLRVPTRAGTPDPTLNIVGSTIILQVSNGMNLFLSLSVA